MTPDLSYVYLTEGKGEGKNAKILRTSDEKKKKKKKLQKEGRVCTHFMHSRSRTTTAVDLRVPTMPGPRTPWFVRGEGRAHSLLALVI